LLRLSVFIAVDRLPAMAAMAASETAKALAAARAALWWGTKFFREAGLKHGGSAYRCFGFPGCGEIPPTLRRQH